MIPLRVEIRRVRVLKLDDQILVVEFEVLAEIPLRSSLRRFARAVLARLRRL